MPIVLPLNFPTSAQCVFQALTVQSLVPTLSIFPAPVAYSLIQFGVLRPHLFSYFVVPCIGIGPAIDPIVTIYYVTPYRRFVSATLLSKPFITLDTQHAQSTIYNERRTRMSNHHRNIVPTFNTIGQ
ncbi:hypothetical protein Aduo_014640 [Ancylostoma duodenale]